MDDAVFNEDKALLGHASRTMCVCTLSIVPSYTCLPLQSSAIYPDLVSSGSISASFLCWTEMDIHVPKALLAANVQCKTLQNGVCIKLQRLEYSVYLCSEKEAL